MDVIYRFDPFAPIPTRTVTDADAAIELLTEGNRRFARFVGRMQQRMQGGQEESIVVPVHPVTLGLPLFAGSVLSQSPFGLVVCCSDARMNVESIFNQLFNSLFVVRIAGNILGTECLGSVDYALKHLDSLKLVLALGHSQCGAVTAAVDSYLTPQEFGEIAFTHPLRSLIDRLQIAVRISANTLQQQLGTRITQHAAYREALIESSVFLNAAVTAFDLHREVENLGQGSMKVVYGVYDFETLLVRSKPHSQNLADEAITPFRDAPFDQDEFRMTAIEIAEIVIPRYGLDAKSTPLD